MFYLKIYKYIIFSSFSATLPKGSLHEGDHRTATEDYMGSKHYVSNE